MTVTFAELTTMRVGGPVKRLDVATTGTELIGLVQRADQAGEPLLVIGGGSNIVVGDAGWDGTVIKVASTQLHIDGELVTAAAGMEWDHLVKTTIAEGLVGLETLSGIPGSVGGTPVQNVGAYGTLTADVLESLLVYDRQTGQAQTWRAEQCRFGPHRTSVFKRSDRWVVVSVTYRLRRGPESRPIRYAELAQTLDVPLGGTAAPWDVREAVLAIRRRKRMVLDPDDHDTWSVGSFFVNPVLPEVPARASACPQYPDPAGTKLSAAWLIQHAGFPPGYGTGWGSGTVALSSRHTLALTNRGGATTADVMAFAAHIRAGVQAAFDVRLHPECDLVNCSF